MRPGSFHREQGLWLWSWGVRKRKRETDGGRDLRPWSEAKEKRLPAETRKTGRISLLGGVGREKEEDRERDRDPGRETRKQQEMETKG